MSYTLVSDRIRPCSKRLANEWRDKPFYGPDRPLKEHLKAAIIAEVKARTFHTCHWVEAVLDGKTYRVNGKHTSTSLSDPGVDPALLPGILVRISTFRCTEPEDVAKLYATFDARLSAKTQGDINRAYCAGSDVLSGLSARVRDTISAGLALSVYEDSADQKGMAVKRGELLAKSADFAAWVVALLSGQKQTDIEYLLRAPVVAAMHRTWKVSQRASMEFWTLVGSGSADKPTDPTRVLGKRLMRTTVGVGRGASIGKSTDTRRGMTVRCLHAWNAWRKGKSTDLKYYPGSPVPAAC